MINYLKQRRFYFLFLSIILLFGIGIGIYLGISNIVNIKENILNAMGNIGYINYNYILIHFFLLSMGVLLSFVGIGIPLLLVIIFYEGLCNGFLLSVFTILYSAKGLLFAIIYYLLTQGLFLFVLFIILIKCTLISRKMIGKFLYKTSHLELIIHLLKSCLLWISLVLAYDILFYFFGNHFILVLLHLFALA